MNLGHPIAECQHAVSMCLLCLSGKYEHISENPQLHLSQSAVACTNSSCSFSLSSPKGQHQLKLLSFSADMNNVLFLQTGSIL